MPSGETLSGDVICSDKRFGRKSAGEFVPPSNVLTGLCSARASGLRARGVVFTQYNADRLRKGDTNDVVLILAALLETFD